MSVTATIDAALPARASASAAPPDVVVVAIGSLGDLHPFMALALAYQQRGRNVSFIASMQHAARVQAAGLRFIPLATQQDYDEAVANPDLWHPRRGLSVLMKGYARHLSELVQHFNAWPVVQALTVIAHPLALPAMAIVQATRPLVRVVGAYLAPSNLRSCRDPMLWGPLQVPTWVPTAWRRAMWRAADAWLIDPVALPEVNRARADHGLLPVQHFWPHLQQVPNLSVTLYPSWFAPTPDDGPKPLVSLGFTWYDTGAASSLNEAVSRFLAQGEAPVVVTFGSANHHAAQAFACTLAALQRLNLRAIVLTAHRAQLPEQLGPQVLWRPYVPLALLLRQSAALVHHGGIGTMAEALRAGVAQLVLPFAWDQFDNAARAVALGVAASLPANRVKTSRVVERLQRVVLQAATRQRAQRLALQCVDLDDDDA